jgi:hypothetical protein
MAKARVEEHLGAAGKAGTGGISGFEPVIREAVHEFQILLRTANLSAVCLGAFAGRAVLRVTGILSKVGKERYGDLDGEALLKRIPQTLKLVLDCCSRGAMDAGQVEELNWLHEGYRSFRRLPIEEGIGRSAGWWAGWWAAHAADHLLSIIADRGKETAFTNAAEAVADALNAVGKFYPGPASLSEVTSLRQAVVSDLNTLMTNNFPQAFDISETGPLGLLWPAALGDPPAWYREFRAWQNDLTSTAEDRTVVPMPSKDARPGQDGPALQEVKEAFQEATLPPVDLGHLSPKEAVEVLKNIEATLLNLRPPLLKRFNAALGALAGHRFDTNQENDEMVGQINRVRHLLDAILTLNDERVGFTFSNPQGFDRTGSFQARGRREGKEHKSTQTTVYSAEVVPELEAKPTPPDPTVPDTLDEEYVTQQDKPPRIDLEIPQEAVEALKDIATVIEKQRSPLFRQFNVALRALGEQRFKTHDENDQLERLVNRVKHLLAAVLTRHGQRINLRFANRLNKDSTGTFQARGTQHPQVTVYSDRVFPNHLEATPS